MKIDKSIVGSFVLLLAIASLYRIMPGRVPGFAPQIAMALFSGSIVKNKKFAFLLPLVSMLVSDIIYEILFRSGISAIPGFYEGQVVNYGLFALLTMVGFMINKSSVLQIAVGSVVGASFYFLASNLLLWMGGGLGLDNLPYAKTWEGLLSCYAAAVPFYKISLYATLFFNAIFFAGYYLINKYAVNRHMVAR